MLFILAEIILTIIAWMRGWKWRALALSAILAGALLMRWWLADGEFDDFQDMLNVSVFVHVVYIIALLRLVIKPRVEKTGRSLPATDGSPQKESPHERYLDRPM
jgi:hypothetical protein